MSKHFPSCSDCICGTCFLREKHTCPHGECYDSLRAKINPYDKAHPYKPTRTGWSNWKTQQSFWCRGGVNYPVNHCDIYVEYTGVKVTDCIGAAMSVFQDGTMRCGWMSDMDDLPPCDECYEYLIAKTEREG